MPFQSHDGSEMSWAPGRRSSDDRAATMQIPTPPRFVTNSLLDGDQLPASSTSAAASLVGAGDGSSGPSFAICSGPARWMCAVGYGHLCHEGEAQNA